jgi:DNA-binding NarL/FixJ family response regulator
MQTKFRKQDEKEGRTQFRVLIADDHEVVRRGIRTVLEARRDWQVCGEAATGGETIEKAARLRPDVLLLDLTLPDMDPAQAIPEIMEICPNVKIIGLAMHDSGELAAGALAAGASGLTMKSDAANDLLLTLQQIGKNQLFLSSAAVKLLQVHLATTRTPRRDLKDLTPRELQILKLRVKGCPNKEIARSLEISVKTVDAHRASIMRKLKLVTYSDLIQFAIRHKLVQN